MNNYDNVCFRFGILYESLRFVTLDISNHLAPSRIKFNKNPSYITNKHLSCPLLSEPGVTPKEMVTEFPEITAAPSMSTTGITGVSSQAPGEGTTGVVEGVTGVPTGRQTTGGGYFCTHYYRCYIIFQ